MRSFSSGDLLDLGGAGIARIDSMSLDPLDLALRNPIFDSGSFLQQRALSSPGQKVGVDAQSLEIASSGSREMDRMEAAAAAVVPGAGGRRGGLSPRWRFAGKPGRGGSATWMHRGAGGTVTWDTAVDEDVRE
jgi:hypothetical protein